jgi:transcriptional regulator with XRE-family HTH domain
MASVYARQLGATVKALRSRLGLSQDAAAKAMGTNQSTVSRIERGDSEPSLRDLYALAQFFGVTAAELLSGVQEDRIPVVSIARSVTCEECGVITAGLTAELAHQARADHIREHLAASP